MTVVHLQHTSRKRTPTTMRGSHRKPGTRREIMFGTLVAAALVGLACIAAFNGGMSLEAGGLAVQLDMSMSTGMQLSFASL